LADDPALGRCITTVGIEGGEEAIVIVDSGDQVWIEENVGEAEIIQDVSRLGDFIGDVGINLRRGRDIKIHGMVDAAAGLGRMRGENRGGGKNGS
jgi:hypothetical protein